MVATAQIELAEVFGTMQPVKQLIHSRQWVLVLDGDLVQAR